MQARHSVSSAILESKFLESCAKYIVIGIKIMSYIETGNNMTEGGSVKSKKQQTQDGISCPNNQQKVDRTRECNVCAKEDQK